MSIWSDPIWLAMQGGGGGDIAWEGPYNIQPLNCDDSYANRIQYYKSGKLYYFFVDIRYGGTVGAYADTKIASLDSIISASIDTAFGVSNRYSSSSTYPALLAVSGKNLVIRARYTGVNKPYFFSCGLYIDTNTSTRISVSDTDSGSFMYAFETDGYVTVNYWLVPTSSAFFGKKVAKLQNPVLPFVAYTTLDDSTTLYPVTVDSDGYVTFPYTSVNRIVCGSFSYRKAKATGA